MRTVLNFIKGAYDEFKKVQWPTRGQTIRLTAYVIGVSLIVGLYVAAVDFGYQEILKIALNR